MWSPFSSVSLLLGETPDDEWFMRTELVTYDDPYGHDDADDVPLESSLLSIDRAYDLCGLDACHDAYRACHPSQ